MWNRGKEITPEEVKKLDPGTRVVLQGTDRHGEINEIEGKIFFRDGKKMFLYSDYYEGFKAMSIRKYKGKKWLVFD